jgi:hypothetical protein
VGSALLDAVLWDSSIHGRVIDFDQTWWRLPRQDSYPCGTGVMLFCICGLSWGLICILPVLEFSDELRFFWCLNRSSLPRSSHQSDSIAIMRKKMQNIRKQSNLGGGQNFKTVTPIQEIWSEDMNYFLEWSKVQVSQTQFTFPLCKCNTSYLKNWKKYISSMWCKYFQKKSCWIISNVLTCSVDKELLFLNL